MCFLCLDNRSRVTLSPSRVFSRKLTNGGIFNNRLLFENNMLLFSVNFCGGTRPWWMGTKSWWRISPSALTRPISLWIWCKNKMQNTRCPKKCTYFQAWEESFTSMRHNLLFNFCHVCVSLWEMTYQTELNLNSFALALKLTQFIILEFCWSSPFWLSKSNPWITSTPINQFTPRARHCICGHNVKLWYLNGSKKLSACQESHAEKL